MALTGMMCLRVLERVRFKNIATFFRPSNELPDREITANSASSKTSQKLFTTENTEDTEKTFLLLTAPMALLTK
jgi:hypothetical protein